MKPLIIKDWKTKQGHQAYLVLYLGHINGYVIPKKEELKNSKLDYYIYDDSELKNLPKNLRKIQNSIHNIEVHGGLTYYGTHLFDEYAFGFDTAHYNDKPDYDFNLQFKDQLSKEEIEKIEKMKEIDNSIDFSDGIFRDKEYCTQECEKLSEQIKKIEDSIK